MALTIEDGTGVAGADSYATAAELAAYATRYGLTVPATVADQEVLLRRAAAAMDSLNWRGTRTHRAQQALAWPRLGIVAHGEVIGSTVIPGQIKAGQMVLAAEIHADDLAPPDDKKGAVLREKVDTLEVEYAEVRRLSRAVTERPSITHFAEYLQSRGGAVGLVRA